MRIRTLLNRVYKLKHFVYESERFDCIDGKDCLVVDISARRNSKPVCSGCNQRGRIYDHQSKARYFEFIPLWGITVFFCYVMRRVDCRRCGVKIESLPWCDGKNHLSTPYRIFLARWARRLSWKEVADVFGSSWDKVYRSVAYVVEYGLKNRVLSGIEAIGIDEIHFGKGQSYLTVVYQLDEGKKRLLYTAEQRTVKSLLGFFRVLGKENTGSIKYVCSDMWKPYLKVIRKKLPEVLHILDRFHIVAHLSNAVNDVRVAEAKKMKADGYEDILKNSKYCFLKNPENLTEAQNVKLKDLLKYDLKSVRAYQLKESFNGFWEYKSVYWAERYLTWWCARAMRSKLDPIKKFVGMVRRHQPLMMNWFKAKKAYSSGTVEGLNRKINLVTRKSYGFRSYDVLKMALFHTMGALPEPEMAHRFC